MDLKMIKARIEQSGLKQRDLAKSIDVDPSTLNRFLNGRTVLNGIAMLALFQILKIDPSSFNNKAS